MSRVPQSADFALVRFPEVRRDVTYVLDRPAGRTYKIAYGSRWLWEHHGPEQTTGESFDFVLYLDDDAFVSLPRLLPKLVGRSGRLVTEDRLRGVASLRIEDLTVRNCGNASRNV